MGEERAAGGNPLPVVIVAGLHADARNAVVEGLLRSVPGSLALHHDLTTAAEGTVRRGVRDASGERSSGSTPLVNDCACCALRQDLIPELERLAEDFTTRLAIVELWDSVEPKAMAEVVDSHGGSALELTNVITAVDPALVLPYLANGDDLAEAGLAAAATDRRTIGDTWARQLEYAPVLALVECDTPDGREPADDADRALLTQLHPTARQVPAGSGSSPRWPSPASTSRPRRRPITRPVPSCRTKLTRRASAPSSGTVDARSTPSVSTRRWRTSVVVRPVAGVASGLPTDRTPCSPGTPPVARSAWRARAPGSPPYRMLPGNWCRPCARSPPHSTGTPSTETAVSISSSLPPALTAMP